MRSSYIRNRIISLAFCSRVSEFNSIKCLSWRWLWRQTTMRRIFVLIFFLFYFRNSHSVYIAFASLNNGHRAAATATETTTTVHWQQCMNNNIYISNLCTLYTDNCGGLGVFDDVCYLCTYIYYCIYIYIYPNLRHAAANCWSTVYSYNTFTFCVHANRPFVVIQMSLTYSIGTSMQVVTLDSM